MGAFVVFSSQISENGSYKMFLLVPVGFIWYNRVGVRRSVDKYKKIKERDNERKYCCWSVWRPYSRY